MIEFSDITSNVCKAEFINSSQTVAIASGTKLLLREASVENYHDVKTLPFGESFSSFSFSPDSEYYLTLSTRKSLVMVYNAEGEAVAKIQDEAIGIENAIWAPDSRQVITFSNYQIRMSVYNLVDKSVCYIKSPKYTNKGCSFTQDGRFMALSERRDTKDFIGIYFTKDWRPVNYFQIDMLDLSDLMWSPNNNFIVAWDTCLNYKLIPICPLMGPITCIQPYESALGIKTVCFSNDSTILAVGSFDEKIRLFNALTWKLICQIECKPTLASNPDMSAWRQDQLKVGLQTTARFVPIEGANIKIPTNKVVLSQTSTAPPKQGIGLLEFSPDDCFLACRNDNMPNTVWIWEMRRLELKCILNLSKHVKSIKWSPKTAMLSIATGSTHFYFWNSNGKVPSCCDMPFENKAMEVQKVKWSEDGKNLLLYDKNNVCMCTFRELLDE